MTGRASRTEFTIYLSKMRRTILVRSPTRTQHKGSSWINEGDCARSNGEIGDRVVYDVRDRHRPVCRLPAAAPDCCRLPDLSDTGRAERRRVRADLHD